MCASAQFCYRKMERDRLFMLTNHLAPYFRSFQDVFVVFA